MFGCVTFYCLTYFLLLLFFRSVRVMKHKDEILECCECATAVGIEGPQRGSFLLPCQHVMHMSCLEFYKQQANLLRRLYNGQRELQLDLVEDVAVSEEIKCPRCSEKVQRIVPLFVAAPEDYSFSAIHHESEENMQKVLKAQKSYLDKLRGLTRSSKRVLQLGRQCAGLHNQREALLNEMKQFNKFLPVLSPPPPGERTAEEGSPLLAIDRMNKTELELYLAQTAPSLAQSQVELLREREQVDRRKKTLNALRLKYQNLKAERGGIVRPREPEEDEDTNCFKRQRLTAIHLSHPSRRGVPAIDVDTVPERVSTVEGKQKVYEILSDEEDSNAVIHIDSEEDTSSVPPAETESPEGSVDYFVPHPQSSINCSKTAHFVRLLPRREDRLWQPSLQF
ncbi:hypothetical protein, conserved [Angomonas deanei]|uniref:RING-type domain-containing protein n=1 Tax=Angomonas deanei TaxID=59799 RepID=A0A7G2CIG6_9TRYP|nr:hypothetical protein, conserved [Angomonas deanei]